MRSRKQKQSWCRRELGASVRVITCASHEKHHYGGSGAVLIDDTEQLRAAWEQVGGRFIHSLPALHGYCICCHTLHVFTWEIPSLHTLASSSFIRWFQAGGHFILHTDTQSTLVALQRLLKLTPDEACSVGRAAAHGNSVVGSSSAELSGAVGGGTSVASDGSGSEAEPRRDNLGARSGTSPSAGPPDAAGTTPAAAIPSSERGSWVAAYCGIFLDDESRALLARVCPPRHVNVSSDHVTLCARPDKAYVQQLLTHVGERCSVRVACERRDSRAQVMRPA